MPLFAHFLHFRCVIQIFRWDIRFLRFDIIFLFLYLSWLTKLVIINPWGIKVWSGIIFNFYTRIQINVLLNLFLNFLCKAKWVKLAIFINNRRLCYFIKNIITNIIIVVILFLHRLDLFQVLKLIFFIHALKIFIFAERVLMNIL